MTGQVREPLSDGALRTQLARRASGTMPPALAADVLDALDRVPKRVAAPARPGWLGRPGWSSLRLAGSAAAIVALAAALTLLPAARPAAPTFSGAYPAQRPLTADELGRVMAGAELPRLTTLVAQVTIAAAPASCTAPSPYRVVGAVATVSGAVCVVGPAAPPGSGILAFRVLGPKLLGYLADVSPAGATLVHAATDAWPLDGRAFLVDGWLGGYELAMSCLAETIPDPLSPGSFGACPWGDWLADRADPPEFGVREASSTIGPYMAVPESPWARRVNGGPYYLYPPGTAAGSYVPQTEQRRPSSSGRGIYLIAGAPAGCSDLPLARCISWNVLAKVDEIAIPSPEPTFAAVTPLTTEQLAAALDGGITQGITFVATTSIENRPDVCPMNSHRTLGLVLGVSAETCVVFDDPSLTRSAPIVQGTFAFRYLGARTLLLLGEIAPVAPDRIAYRVAEEWPLAGRTFLAEGWLGATRVTGIECPATVPAKGSVPPLGDECPYESWLSDGPTPRLTAEPMATERMNLRGSTRLVDAGGARVRDALPASGPAVHGTFVVRSKTTACPGALPIDSTGCGAWEVLGLVRTGALPKPTSGPTASPTPRWPAPDRALTPDELARVAGDPEVPLYTTVAAAVTIDSAAGTCPSRDPYVTAGRIAGLEPAVCVYARAGTKVASTGLFALRVLGPRALGYLALLQPGPGGFAWNPGAEWSKDNAVVVQGWLDVADCLQASLPPFGGVDPLEPVGPRLCHAAISTTAWSEPFPTPSLPEARSVDAAPYLELPYRAGAPDPIPGLFVVRFRPHCSIVEPTECESWEVLAGIYGYERSPENDMGPSPSPAAPAPTIPPAVQSEPTGALVALADLRAKPGAFDGRIAIMADSLEGSTACSSGVAFRAAADSMCLSAGSALPGISPDAAWLALRVMPDGTLAYLGRLGAAGSIPTGSISELRSLTPAGELLLVDGWLHYSALSSDMDRATAANAVPVGAGAYARFADPVDAPRGAPSRGVYLVRNDGLPGGAITILCRLDGVGFP